MDNLTVASTASESSVDDLLELEVWWISGEDRPFEERIKVSATVVYCELKAYSNREHDDVLSDLSKFFLARIMRLLYLCASHTVHLLQLTCRKIR